LEIGEVCAVVVTKTLYAGTATSMDI
jgi:Na+-translocating ferredoxin:NAD+ oxidoreductase RnfD subunit